MSNRRFKSGQVTAEIIIHAIGLYFLLGLMVIMGVAFIISEVFGGSSSASDSDDYSTTSISEEIEVEEKYQSKAECEEAGRDGAKSTPDGDVFYVRCLEDGSWEVFDPDYEDYLMEQNIKNMTAINNTVCEDITSYDYDWNNDMLCTNPDGSQFYTSYEGAASYGY